MTTLFSLMAVNRMMMGMVVIMEVLITTFFCYDDVVFLKWIEFVVQLSNIRFCLAMWCSCFFSV